MKAAGVLILSADGTALFLKRSATGDHPGEWCLPGGGQEGSETAEETARRECEEEIGSVPKGDFVLHTTTSSAAALSLGPIVEVAPGAAPPSPPAPGVTFTTFLLRVKAQFEPKLNSEHDGYAWAPATDAPMPLHPGVKVALDRLEMDELGVAKAMVAGQLTSPQHYMNVTLYKMRITGTGIAYRRKFNEFAYRRPEHYLTPEFLERCNGLSVIMQHPAKSGMLNSKEYGDRVVGSMMVPYIDGDEVWGIAKVYDADAIQMMAREQLSTSPMVVLRDTKENFRVELEDGSTLLIEGKPSLLDHLAICERGVWDKGEEPSGINRGDSDMTPEEMKAKKDADEKAAADKVKADADEKEAREKADADAGQKLDKILECLDSTNKRMDSFEEDIKKDKAKKDAESMTEAEKVAADKAKKDADEEEKKEKEKEKADADAKVKADNDEAVRKAIADLQAKMPKAITDEDYHKMADAQGKADSVFNKFGARAPRPLEGEDLVGYRRRLSSTLKQHSPVWKDIDLTKIADDAAFAIAETQIYADADAAALNPSDLPAGALREVHRVNPATGGKTIEFYGANTFIAGLTRPGRLVRSLKAPRKDD